MSSGGGGTSKTGFVGIVRKGVAVKSCTCKSFERFAIFKSYETFSHLSFRTIVERVRTKKIRNSSSNLSILNREFLEVGGKFDERLRVTGCQKFKPYGFVSCR